MKRVNTFRSRKLSIRARSRDMRCGLGFQRYDALWRFASIPKHKRRAAQALRLLERRHVLMETDPSAYFRSPTGRRKIEDEEPVVIGIN